MENSPEQVSLFFANVVISIHYRPLVLGNSSGKVSINPLSPALGDVDGDGTIEIVVGSEDGYLYVIDPPTAGQRIYWQGYGGTMSFDRTRNLLYVDRDQDFLSDYSENILGTNASDPDSDNDGLPDGWEIGYGFDPLNPTDALLDSDGLLSQVTSTRVKRISHINPWINSGGIFFRYS